MINRQKFFDLARERLFGGKLTERQVQGTTALLDEMLLIEGIVDLRFVACILGTAKWETAHTMWPVRETQRPTEPDIDDATARRRLGNAWYAKPDPETGHSYYGRGFVQLTHKENYRKMGKILDVDLVALPDTALDLVIATEIIVEGMMRKNSGIGDFTGASLEDFITPAHTDWVGTRRVVNGLDKAEEIAQIHRQFHAILQECSE